MAARQPAIQADSEAASQPTRQAGRQPASKSGKPGSAAIQPAERASKSRQPASQPSNAISKPSSHATNAATHPAGATNLLNKPAQPPCVASQSGRQPEHSASQPMQLSQLPQTAWAASRLRQPALPECQTAARLSQPAQPACVVACAANLRSSLRGTSAHQSAQPLGQSPGEARLRSWTARRRRQLATHSRERANAASWPN